MKTLFSAVAAAALAAPGLAADAPLPNVSPAMWVVKDKDTTIYMFGTFHMLDGKQDWFNDEVKTAFETSDELVLEAKLPENPAEMQPLVMKYAVDPAGKTLSAKLTADLKARLDKELGTLGIPAKAFDPLEPWFVSMTMTGLGAQKLGLKGDKGPEMILSKAAKAANKPIGELEGMEMQLGMLDRLPEEKQVAMLGQTLDSMAKLNETLQPMLSAWSKGDGDGLIKIMTDGMNDADLYKVMLTDRNAKWADWVQQRLAKPGTVFMAVGAGHLAGKGSVQDYLAAKGIKSERVKN